jgi:hypothetical protein
MDANQIRKEPQNLNVNQDVIDAIVLSIEQNIARLCQDQSKQTMATDVCFGHKKVNDSYWVVVEPKQRKQLVRKVSEIMLANNFDVMYETFTFENIDFTKLRIKW